MPSATAAAFRALSDHTRREILTLLRAKPRTSGEIADHFQSSWPTISRHLAVLKHGGLVLAERRGQEIYYELNTSVFQDVAHQVLEWAGSRRAATPHGARRVARHQESS